MSKCTVFKLADGSVAVCHIARVQGAAETNEDFYHAVTRRELGNQLRYAKLAAMGEAALVEYLSAHDAARTLEAEAATIGVTVVGIMEASALPQRDAYRGAWTVNAGTVTHDMPKAREMHRNALRLLRKPLFEKFDADYMKALELNDTATMAAIAAKRQALRDAPAYPAIDAAVTVAELKAAVPPILQ